MSETSQLVAATTSLLEAVNVKKQTLDNAVAAAEVAESRAVPAAAKAEAKAIEAQQARDQASQIAGLENVEAAVNAAPAFLDGNRRAVERASGGKRTIIYDAFSNANVMNVFHKTTYENLKLQSIYGTGVIQAFQKASGADFSEIFLATFQSSGNQYVSEARQIPKYNVSYNQVVAGHKAKGAGWGTLSIWDRALLVHIMEALDWQPRGNTAHGMAHDATHEWGQRQDELLTGDSAGTGNILTGTGPDTWNHDGTPHGVADLVGNLWEWIYGMKIVDGRFFLDLHNNQGAESGWAAQNAYVTGPGAPQLASAKAADTASSQDPWLSLSKKEGYVSSELLKRALIEPAGQSLALNGRFYANTSGERLPLVGGFRSNAGSAGPTALNLNDARTAASTAFTSRARFAV